MSVLPIFTYGAPVLRKKAMPVESVTNETVKFVMDMFETMRNAQGIGLAATQVGYLQRILVVDVSDIEELKDVKPITVINPEVVEQDGLWTMEEGCLSIPDVRDEVDRVERIVLRFRDASFNSVELEASGLLARVLLHEIDHLNGTLFLDHLSKEKKKSHRDQLRLIEQGEVEVTYPIVTAASLAV